jgi:hypothetical protein
MQQTVLIGEENDYLSFLYVTIQADNVFDGPAGLSSAAQPAVMSDLQKWMQEQSEPKKAEPNPGQEEAVQYMPKIR